MKVQPQRTSVRFGCDYCQHVWLADPERVDPDPACEYHPWRYFCACPACGNADQQQHPQERKLLKMWANATGPKTAEGKAKVRMNVAGHPTPEEALRTRFNGMKHGLNAEVATYFPARPGKYAECDGCEFRRNICGQQTACIKKTEMMMQHHVAFENRDPRALTAIRTRMQFGVTAIIDSMISAIAREGVSLRTPRFTTDKDGHAHQVTFVGPDGQDLEVHDIQAHPLLSKLTEFLQRNNLSLADLAMTPKIIDEEEVAKGNLMQNETQRETIAAFQERQTTAIESLSAMINRAREASAKDPVLVEFQQGGGDVG